MNRHIKTKSVAFELCRFSLFLRDPIFPDYSEKEIPKKTIEDGLDGGSGIHYSLKIEPIIHFINILGYSLK